MLRRYLSRLFVFGVPLLILSVSGSVLAETPSTQKEGKLRLGHYSSGDGLKGFVLDRTGSKPLLRLDGQNEILVLTPQAGVADGSHLVGDEGTGVAEIGKDASVSLYVEDRNEGIASYRDADAEPLRIAAGTEQAAKAAEDTLLKTVKEVTAGVATVEIDWATVRKDARSWAVLSDAIANTERAIKAIGSDELGKKALAQGLKKVRFVSADTAKAECATGVLSITYAPAKELEGRLSSKAITGILEKSL